MLLRLGECRGKLHVVRNGRPYKPRQYTVLTGFGPNTNLGVYVNSVDTIERAFVERYFLCKDGEGYRPAFKVGPSCYRSKLMKEFRSKVNAGMPYLPLLTRQQVVDRYVGSKRMLYQNAASSLLIEPLTIKDSYLSNFVKYEKQDVSKAPRGISPRSPRFNLELGRRLKHAEHSFFNSINDAYGGRTKATVIKGFNMAASAEILHDKWKLFNSPVAIGLDATKFDMHVSVEALKYEHSFYTSLFPGDKDLRQLLKWQLYNKGRARAHDGSVTFEMEGCRSSGDLNTSLGNCLLMCSLIYAYAAAKRINIELANNGDDCVVFLEETDAPQFNKNLDSWFKKRGFAMQVEPIVDVFEKVEFCQAHPVHTETGWRMVRNHTAVLYKDPMCLTSLPTTGVYRKWLAAVGDCGTALAGDIPCQSALYKSFCKHGSNYKPQFQAEVFRNRSQLSNSLGITLGSITPEVRASYYYAFGVLPDFQIAMETHYREINIDVDLPSQIINRDMVDLTEAGCNIVQYE